MDEAGRAALTAVAEALRPLHKSLLDVTRLKYEREHAPVPGPAALFQLVVHDPSFAWLRTMSGLMAQIDELLDDVEAFTAASAAELRARIETLLVDESQPFAQRYLPILQSEHEVIVEHAALRRALSKL